MISPEKIKSLLSSAVSSVANTISKCVANPAKDFTRNRKLPADTVLTYLISEGSLSTKNEM